MSNVLEKLLKLDKRKLDELPQETIEVKSLSKKLGEKIEITIQALDAQKHSDIQRFAVSFDKRGGLKDIDSYQMQVQTIIAGVVEPSLKDKELQKHFGAPTAEELVKKLFLAGELSDISGRINELSGFERNQEEVNEEIKN